MADVQPTQYTPGGTYAYTWDWQNQKWIPTVSGMYSQTNPESNFYLPSGSAQLTDPYGASGGQQRSYYTTNDIMTLLGPQDVQQIWGSGLDYNKVMQDWQAGRNLYQQYANPNAAQYNYATSPYGWNPSQGAYPYMASGTTSPPPMGGGGQPDTVPDMTSTPDAMMGGAAYPRLTSSRTLPASTINTYTPQRPQIGAPTGTTQLPTGGTTGATAANPWIGNTRTPTTTSNPFQTVTRPNAANWTAPTTPTWQTQQPGDTYSGMTNPNGTNNINPQTYVQQPGSTGAGSGAWGANALWQYPQAQNVTGANPYQNWNNGQFTPMSNNDFWSGNYTSAPWAWQNLQNQLNQGMQNTNYAFNTGRDALQNYLATYSPQSMTDPLIGLLNQMGNGQYGGNNLMGSSLADVTAAGANPYNYNSGYGVQSLLEQVMRFGLPNQVAFDAQGNPIQGSGIQGLTSQQQGFGQAAQNNQDYLINRLGNGQTVGQTPIDTGTQNELRDRINEARNMGQQYTATTGSQLNNLANGSQTLSNYQQGIGNQLGNFTTNQGNAGGQYNNAAMQQLQNLMSGSGQSVSPYQQQMQSYLTNQLGGQNNMGNTYDQATRDVLAQLVGGTGQSVSPYQGELQNTAMNLVKGGGLTPEYVSAMRNLVLDPSQEALTGRLNQYSGGAASLSSPAYQEMLRRNERDFNDQLIANGQNQMQGYLGQAANLGSTGYNQGLNTAQLTGGLGSDFLNRALQYANQAQGAGATGYNQGLQTSQLAGGLSSDTLNRALSALGQSQNLKAYAVKG